MDSRFDWPWSPILKPGAPSSMDPWSALVARSTISKGAPPQQSPAIATPCPCRPSQYQISKTALVTVSNVGRLCHGSCAPSIRRTISGTQAARAHRRHPHCIIDSSASTRRSERAWLYRDSDDNFGVLPYLAEISASARLGNYARLGVLAGTHLSGTFSGFDMHGHHLV